ncbi:MAG: malate/lactate/ureidoglycolate dehydrogenase [Gammaproteobacteria bacterium]|nr:malate/lactate/ureidoglycolate dehydrogenase [Gammaproteobacteria bacterium]
MLVAAPQLEQFAAELLATAGAPRERADETANHLVLANLKGHDSHGVGMIPHYLHAMRHGELCADADYSVFRDAGPVIGVDAKRCFGQVAGRIAMDLGLKRVSTLGLAVIAVRGAYHLGRIGSYAEQCARENRISLHFVNATGHAPLVVPWGGREARFMTNPFCCGIPRTEHDPLILDMATSLIALGKVRVAHARGERLAPGALMDSEGSPTDDPGSIFEGKGGNLVPFGRHKGSGLGLICELLGGAFAGEWSIQPAHPRGDRIINNMLSIILDCDLFGGEARFREEVEAMIEYVQSSKPAKGVDRVRIAGEPEREAMAGRSSHGIEVEDATWQSLLRAGERLGIQFN